MFAFCINNAAACMDDRPEPQTLTAGVLEPTVEGVICGVGRGPIRAKAGVGGAISVRGSRKRGNIAKDVGVLSCEVDCVSIGLRMVFVDVDVGVAGVDKS